MNDWINAFISTLIVISTTLLFAIIFTLIIKLYYIFAKKTSKLEINNNQITLKIDKNLQKIAREVYIELKYRKFAVSWNENDVLSEVLNSYYICFQKLRDFLKVLGDHKQEKKLFNYISEFLNEDLRLFLEQYQHKYREWIAKQKKLSSYVNENISQKKYEHYTAIVLDIKNIYKKSNKICDYCKIIGYNKSWLKYS